MSAAIKHTVLVLLLVASLLVGGFSGGVAEASKANIISYPAGVDTDYEKLQAVYSLLEQMRLEHNRQGEIARSNWDKYKGKWYEYAHRPASLGGSVFWNKVLPLLREQNRLKGNIRKAAYTDEQWKALSEDGRDAVLLELYGDKAVERDKATKATSPLLDELETISLNNLDGETPPDPLEDWTTYTETDPNGYLTVAANQVTITDMPRNQSTFLYDDKGADHFGTTFSSPHLLSSEYGNIDNAAEIIIWGLTNTTNFSFYTEDVFFLIWEDYASQKPRFFMDDGGVDNYDNSNVCSADTQYWFTINRGDPSTCAIYSDSDRTNLLDTLSIPQGTNSFRYIFSAASRGGSGSGASNAVVYDLDLQEGGGPSAPTVTTQAASSIEDTTATGNGNITATGGENADHRGVVWDDASPGDPGDTAPDASDYVTAGGGYTDEAGDFGTGAFTASMTGLPTGTTVYYRAWAHNSSGYSYGGEQSFLTKPAAPTNVSATDGDHTDKVVITWTKSTGASGYKIYRDGGLADTVGDVATYDDTGADAGTISNAGTASASDGTSTAHVTLSLAGEATSDGTNHTYKLKASNGTGDSDDSATDTGYRTVGAITYQWQVDSGGGFGNIAGGTTDPYNYASAEAGTITAGNSVASDGSSSLHVTLSLDGDSANNGSTWDYQCIVSSVDASNSPQTSTSDTGYRGTDTVTYQWQVDSGGGFGNIGGGTTNPYNYTGAGAPSITPGDATASDGTSSSYVTLSITGESASNGLTWDYQCILTAAWASNSPQTTATDTGYRGTTALTYQWLRSNGDADNNFGNIAGTTDPYNDTGGAVDPDGRFYYAEVSMTGAVTQDTTHDRGYRLAGGVDTASGMLGMVLGLIIGAGAVTTYDRYTCKRRKAQ